MYIDPTTIREGQFSMMSTDKTDKYEGPDFVIENGIIKSTKTFSGGLQDNNYGELLLETMKANPTFIGQVDGLTGREETFSEMSEKSVKCAMWLKKQNIQPGDVIGVCTHNHLDMYIPCFASLYVGAVVNAWWDVGITKEVVRHFIDMTKPKFVFANEVSARIIHEVIEEMHMEIKVIVFGSLTGFQSLGDILSSEDVKLVPEFRCTKLSSSDDPAVIICSSGSTGLPKGALLSHESLHVNIAVFLENSAPKGPTTSFTPSTLSWLSGLYCVFKGILKPHTRIVCPEVTEEMYFHLIQKYKVNWMSVGASTVMRFIKSPVITNYDLSSVKNIFYRGAVSNETSQKALAECFPHAFVLQAYGSSEFGTLCTTQTPNSKSGSCGTVTVNTSMKIIEPATGKILGPNQEGEACLKSPYMMTGYYGNPEATNEVIDSEGWLHTGDLLYYDREGNLFFVDRLKELIKFRGGHHVSPMMLERLLQGHPAVKEVAVVAMPHIIDIEHPIAFVSKVPNSQVTEEDIKQFSDTLPDYMKLRGGVHFLDELPHTSSGKVDRATLKKLARSYAQL